MAQGLDSTTEVSKILYMQALTTSQVRARSCLHISTTFHRQEQEHTNSIRVTQIETADSS